MINVVSFADDVFDVDTVYVSSSDDARYQNFVNLTGQDVIYKLADGRLVIALYLQDAICDVDPRIYLQDMPCTPKDIYVVFKPAGTIDVDIKYQYKDIDNVLVAVHNYDVKIPAGDYHDKVIIIPPDLRHLASQIKQITDAKAVVTLDLTDKSVTVDSTGRMAIKQFLLLT